MFPYLLGISKYQTFHRPQKMLIATDKHTHLYNVIAQDRNHKLKFVLKKHHFLKVDLQALTQVLYLYLLL